MPDVVIMVMLVSPLYCNRRVHHSRIGTATLGTLLAMIVSQPLNLKGSRALLHGSMPAVGPSPGVSSNQHEALGGVATNILDRRCGVHTGR